MSKKEILNFMNQDVKFKVNEIYPSIYHLVFNTKKDMTSTLVRFQEFYESPEFRNKIFTMPEFIDWYKSSREHKKFSYFSDWSGFNLPSRVLTPFREGDFDPLFNREKAILNQFKGVKGKFYIIATFKSTISQNDEEVIKHELAHAFFYLDPNYNKKVTQILSKVDLSPINHYLKQLGYHHKVFLDEAHAYLLTDLNELKADGVDIKPYSKVIKELNKNFNQTVKQALKEKKSLASLLSEVQALVNVFLNKNNF